VRTWKNYVEEQVSGTPDTRDGLLAEKLVRKYYIERGQRKVKWITDKEGYRVEFDENDMPKEVKMTRQEIMHRRQAAKTSVLKHNKPREQALRKKSFAKRDAMHMDYDMENPDVNLRREEGETLKSDKKGAAVQKMKNLAGKLMKDIVKV
jgi:hypothetical protein